MTDPGLDHELQLFAETIPHMVWIARSDGTLEYANGALYQYAGRERGDLSGWSWERIVHRVDLRALLARWRAALAAREPYDVDARLRRYDGAYRWFTIRANPVRLGSDGPVERWFGTATDVDQLRRAGARNAFLAAADAVFGVELEHDAILGALARAAVESFCDYCLFDHAEPDGSLRRTATEHRDPRRRGPFQRSVGEVPPPDHPVHPIAVAWRSGESVFVPQIDETWWEKAALSAGHLERMRAERLISLITVVVAARGRRYGTLTFCRGRGSTPFDEEDVATAEDLARRVAAALENARLYTEARAAAEAQRRIAERETFFARLGEAVGETLDLHEALRAATSLLVPVYADWTAIDLVDDDGRLVVAASQHRDPDVRNASRAAVLPAVSEAVQTRRGQVLVALSGEPLDVVSAIVVPLLFRGGARGALSVMYDRSSGRHYAHDELPFFEEVARRLVPAIGNAEAYERERRVARTFQAAALTTDLPRVPGTAFDALYEAGRSEALIGGDWYDAFRVGDGRVVVSVGDVAGSGLEAAATMATIRQSLRGAAAINPDPSVMLDAADRVLRSQTADRFVTAWVGVLDPLWSTLACVGAGHPAPLVRDARGDVRPLPAGGLPLGLRERGADVTHHLELEPGDVILLYTDGLIEAERDVIAGEARLYAAFRDADLTRAPARTLHDAIVTHAGASDDIAMLIVAFACSPLAIGGECARRWRFDARDAHEAAVVRRAIDALLARGGLAPDDRLTAELVYAELVGNAARYAPGPLDVALDASGDYAVLHLVDSGPGFHHNPRLPADALAESGRGLYIVSTIAEELSVTRRPGGGAHARAVLRGRLA